MGLYRVVIMATSIARVMFGPATLRDEEEVEQLELPKGREPTSFRPRGLNADEEILAPEHAPSLHTNLLANEVDVEFEAVA
jgi:hypothetical protein